MPLLNIIIVVCAVAAAGSVGFKMVNDRIQASTIVDQLCERLDQLSNDTLKSDDADEKDAIGEIKEICQDRTPVEN